MEEIYTDKKAFTYMANNSAIKATNITIYFQYQEIGYFNDSTALLHIILGCYVQHMFNFIRCTGDFNVCSYQRQNKLIILNCTLKNWHLNIFNNKTKANNRPSGIRSMKVLSDINFEVIYIYSTQRKPFTCFIIILI